MLSSNNVYCYISNRREKTDFMHSIFTCKYRSLEDKKARKCPHCDKTFDRDAVILGNESVS